MKYLLDKFIEKYRPLSIYSVGDGSIARCVSVLKSFYENISGKQYLCTYDDITEKFITNSPLRLNDGDLIRIKTYNSTIPNELYEETNYFLGNVESSNNSFLILNNYGEEIKLSNDDEYFYLYKYYSNQQIDYFTRINSSDIINLNDKIDDACNMIESVIENLMNIGAETISVDTSNLEDKIYQTGFSLARLTGNLPSLTDGLILCFDQQSETVGVSAPDVSGNNNNGLIWSNAGGTLTHIDSSLIYANVPIREYIVPDFIQGPPTNAWTGSSLRIPKINSHGHTSPIPLTTFTLAFWVRTNFTTGMAGEQTLFFNVNTSNVSGWYLWGNSAGHIYFTYCNPSWGDAYRHFPVSYTNGNLYDNEWHFVCVTVDNSLLEAIMYVDGNTKLTGVIQHALVVSDAAYLYVGSMTSAYWFRGNMGLIYMYDRVLSDFDVEYIYNTSAWAYGKHID
jgi:hypothetical protein